ncbi:MAG: response regulator [Bacteroidetes bacterium]|nr:response regulator [Bacteroidota bacterium]
MKYLTLMFIVFCAIFAHGQNQMRFEQVKTDSFEKSWVSDIVQDELGFIWLGTQNGLYRYDGYDLKPFKNVPYKKQSLPGNWARNLQVNSDGTFWISSYGGGLAIFDPRRQVFDSLVFPEDAYGTFISATVSYLDKGLLMVSDKGVFRGQSNESEFEQIPLELTTQIGNIGATSLIKSRDSLYFVSDQISSVSLPNKTMAMSSVDDRQVLFSTRESLIFVNDLHQIDSIPAPDQFHNISNEINGNIYLASEKAIYSFNFENLSFQLVGNTDFGNEKIQVLFVDNEENLWVGTDKGFYKGKITSNFLSATSVDRRVRSMVYADSTLFMVGEFGFLLKKINENEKHLVDDQVFISVAKIDNEIWLGSRYGNIVVADIYGNRLREIELAPDGEKGMAVVSLVEDQQGRVWVGSLAGIYVLNKDGTVLNSYKLPMDSQIENQKIISLKIDSKDRLWVPTASHGLFELQEVSKHLVVNEPVFDHFRYEPGQTNGLSSNIIINIEESPDGTIWVGSDNGLAYYKDHTIGFEHLSINDKLFDEKVMTLKADEFNNLWIATIFNGLYYYDVEAHNIRQFTVSDGILSNAFLYNAVTHDKENGHIYFGSDEGVQRVDTKKFELKESLKPAKIGSLINYQDNKEALLLFENESETNEIELSYGNRDVTINFTNLEYSKIQKVRYAYSFDTENWNPLPNRTAHLTNLSLRDNKIFYKSFLEGQNYFNPDFDGFVNFYVSPPWYKTYFAYSLYLLLLSMVLGYYYTLRTRNKVAKQRVKTTMMIEKTKSNLYANISHEFKTPLTIIGGLTDELLDEENSFTEHHRDLLSIKRNNEQLLNLVSQMLDLVSLDNYQLEPNFKNGDLISFVRCCVEMFSTYAKTKNIELLFQSSSKEIYMDLDDVNLQKVINNLLSNAIKFTPSNGKVLVSIEQIEEENVVMKIKDTGKGINEEELPKIFDRYYKTFDLDSNLGSGIGMELTKGLIEIMDGQITVTSTKGEGTVFSITLPIRHKAKKHPISFTEIMPNTTTMEHIKTVVEANELPNLLLVEDNSDVREYVSGLLNKSYTVYEASDGKEALEMLDREQIDFILSDVVMPNMDGFEFCREVKKHMKSSHIPFIMLTGKDDKESRMKGWELGVDAYLSKPFDAAELLQLIKTLIEKRKNQYQFYKELIEANLSEKQVEKVSDLEFEFIKALQNFAFSSNSKLKIEDLAQQLLMSRTQLHRKITQLTGMSITQYLNHIKMEKSKTLLAKTQLTVAEVAYQLGYDDPKYFSKIFKKEFGLPPSAFRKQ